MADGVYTGVGNRNIIIYGKTLSLVSENGPSNCIIDCENINRAIAFNLGSENEVLLQGFTIQNGYQSTGGGLYSNGSAVIRDCMFRNNFARIGGAIEAYRCSSLTLERCSIENNEALGEGGGICYTGERLIMYECCVIGNIGSDGAGLYVNEVYNGLIANSLISGNQSSGNGGGLQVQLAYNLTISKCILRRNHADAMGGGICFTNASSLELASCVIADNVSGDEGGGLFFSSTFLVNLYDCEILSNESGDHGAGISWTNSELVTLSDCVLENNATAQNGGAIYFHYVDESSFTNCIFSQNSANQNGGCFYWIFSTAAQMKNCTLADNVAGNEGGAFYSDLSAPTVHSSIIYFNSEPQMNIPACRIRFSDVQGGYSGQGNMDADPLFIQGPRGDYYLSQVRAGQDQDSPCLDTQSAYASAVCFDANDGRICLDQLTTGIDFEPDSGHVDMGFHYDLTLAPSIVPPPFIPTPLLPRTNPPEPDSLRASH